MAVPVRREGAAGYRSRLGDRFRYQGRKYQWVGWDRRTQWGSPVPYEYLLSRVRSTGPRMCCYLRATTNPGGYGHEWVRNRFGIADDGCPGSSTRTQRRSGGSSRRGWPITPPVLDRLRPEAHRAVGDGAARAARWPMGRDRGCAARSTAQRWEQHSPTAVSPHPDRAERSGQHVLGFGHERHDGDLVSPAGQARTSLVDYYETNGEALAHYVRVLRDRGYLYGEHHLPHDVEVRELSSGRSRRETLRALGVSVTVVERVEDVQDGIEAARQALATSWFDRELRARHRVPEIVPT